ncbi:unnamed protein product [Absidia cylindrospora]
MHTAEVVHEVEGNRQGLTIPRAEEYKLHSNNHDEDNDNTTTTTITLLPSYGTRHRASKKNKKTTMVSATSTIFSSTLHIAPI